MSKNKGTLYLIPTPIVEGALHTLPAEVLSKAKSLQHFFVENIRTARRFLKAVDKTIDIDQLTLSEISKHEASDTSLFKQLLISGADVGIMSECGCPGIADPGADLVAIAQELGCTVVPLAGPSSIVLALMASGLNGQNFCFNGYLPVKEPLRTQKIKDLELRSKKDKQTEIFIETPYRNQTLLEELLKKLQNSTRLCIALNIGAENTMIQTRSIAQWKQSNTQLPKEPAVFLFLAD